MTSKGQAQRFWARSNSKLTVNIFWRFFSCWQIIGCQSRDSFWILIFKRRFCLGLAFEEKISNNFFLSFLRKNWISRRFSRCPQESCFSAFSIFEAVFLKISDFSTFKTGEIVPQSPYYVGRSVKELSSPHQVRPVMGSIPSRVILLTQNKTCD